MKPQLGAIIIYARDMQKSAAFYREHFGMTGSGDLVGGLIELRSFGGGVAVLIHQAAKSIKLGNVGMKLIFQVEDVAGFVESAAKKGLEFGPVHQADGYQFANTKDPDKNSVSVSSRSLK